MNNPCSNPSGAVSLRRLAVALSAAVALSSSAAAQTPVVRYLFNEGSGTSAANSGSAGSAADMTLNTSNGDLAWSGSSLNAFAGSSLKFDGVPSAPLTNGSTLANANGSAVNGLTSFTITMWINLTSTYQAAEGADRLISMQEVGNGFDLRLNNYSGSNVKLSLWVDGTNTNGADNAVDIVGKWAFIAVTYDGSLASGATNNVAFYGGNSSSTVSQAGSFVTLDKGAVNSVSAATLRLAAANAVFTSADRTPTALFDDVRIYGSALNLSQLDAVRLEGVSAIPEPASAAAVLAGIALAGATAGRRRRA